MVFIRYVNFYLFDQKTFFNSKRHKFNSVSFYRRHSVDCIQDLIKITNYNSIFFNCKISFCVGVLDFPKPNPPIPIPFRNLPLGCRETWFVVVLLFHELTSLRPGGTYGDSWDFPHLVLAEHLDMTSVVQFWGQESCLQKKMVFF